jgi:uncharacterized protein YlzI (FlbEa/FlbD family)
MMYILLTLLMFTRLDGHKIWINTDQIVSVQGASQLKYPTGTLIRTGGGHEIVQENVNQVIREIRGECQSGSCGD